MIDVINILTNMDANTYVQKYDEVYEHIYIYIHIHIHVHVHEHSYLVIILDQ